MPRTDHIWYSMLRWLFTSLDVGGHRRWLHCLNFCHQLNGAGWKNYKSKWDVSGQFCLNPQLFVVSSFSVATKIGTQEIVNAATQHSHTLLSLSLWDPVWYCHWNALDIQLIRMVTLQIAASIKISFGWIFFFFLLDIIFSWISYYWGTDTPDTRLINYYK